MHNILCFPHDRIKHCVFGSLTRWRMHVQVVVFECLMVLCLAGGGKADVQEATRNPLCLPHRYAQSRRKSEDSQLQKTIQTRCKKFVSHIFIFISLYLAEVVILIFYIRLNKPFSQPIN